MTTLETKEMEKDVKKKETSQQEILDFIKEKYPVEKDIFLDIRPLWGNCYRLNFWNKKDPEKQNIMKSYFIVIKKNSKGYEIINYDETFFKDN